MAEKIPPPISYESYIQEIQQMCAEDQAMRTRALENDMIIESEEDNTLDARNTKRMKEIVAEIGWPTISKVGKDISNDAWLLVQHADHDLAFQKQCLEMMKQQPKVDVDSSNIAYLEDRIRVHEGRPQLYGTQFFSEKMGDPMIPRPIEDPNNLDARRKAAGLEPFSEYEKHYKDKYKKYDKPKA